MFSALNDWVGTASEVVKGISDQGFDIVRRTGVLDALESMSAPADTATYVATSQATLLTAEDLLAPPAGWTDSSAEWVWCIEMALRDANTCALHPTTLKADGALWSEIKSIVPTMLAEIQKPNAKVAAALGSSSDDKATSTDVAGELLDKVNQVFAPSPSMVDYIQAHHDIHAVRSAVVPRFATDEDYWLSIGWRLALYKRCTTAVQLLSLMQTLSALPQPLRDTAAAAKRTSIEKNETLANAPPQEGEELDEEREDEESDEDTVPIHLMDNSEYWRRIRLQQDTIQSQFAWLRETEEKVKKEIELANSNVKLLDSLLQRKEVSSALYASVLDSCQYHKVKLSRLIGDICAAPVENSDGTALDLNSGVLFQALTECNDDVRRVLELYAERPSSGPNSPHAGAASKSLATATTPDHRNPAPREEPVGWSSTAGAGVSAPAQKLSPSSSSPVEVSAAEKSDVSEDSFEVTMPWSIGE